MTKTSTHPRFIAAALACAALWAGAARAQPYTGVALADAPGFTTGQTQGINASGLVVGASQSLAVAWNPAAPNTPIVLANLPGQTFGDAYAVNDAGVIVGSSGNLPVLWSSTAAAPTALALPAGITSGWANGVRGNYIVGTGQASGPPFVSEALLWSVSNPGVVTVLPNVAGSTFTLAMAVNASGQIIGFSNNNGALWSATNPALPGVAFSIPANCSGGGHVWGINDAGLVAGYCVANTSGWFGAAWNANAPAAAATILPGLGNPATEDVAVNGVNNSGVIVGASNDRPIYWKTTASVPVQLPNPPGLSIQYATSLWSSSRGAHAINDGDQIAGDVEVVGNGSPPPEQPALWQPMMAVPALGSVGTLALFALLLAMGAVAIVRRPARRRRPGFHGPRAE